MKSLLSKIFVVHWPRKLIAVILAIITWLVVNQSLTSTRNISNVPVRVINLPKGKTVEGMQPNGRLAKKLTLTLVGNKAVIDELTASDLEVVVDAANRPDEWIVIISKKNLVSLNPEIDISKGISRVYHPNFIIRMTQLVTDKIPIIIAQPIGEAPRGYQFLDVWPYRLNLTVSGPKEVIKHLKTKEQRITFNLNDISKADLDELSRHSERGSSDVVTYYVPEQWKQINIPILSDTPLEIDDPEAKGLRIDFIRYSQLPLNFPLPFTLFFPAQNLQKYNPETIAIGESELLKIVRGVPLINAKLYANGVDNLFLETVRDQIEIVAIVLPSAEGKTLDWSVQFINPRELENRYVTTLLSDTSDSQMHAIQPSLREEYLRNRFRSYMYRFQLFESNEVKFDLNVMLQDKEILVEKKATPSLEKDAYAH